MASFHGNQDWWICTCASIMYTYKKKSIFTHPIANIPALMAHKLWGFWNRLCVCLENVCKSHEKLQQMKYLPLCLALIRHYYVCEIFSQICKYVGCLTAWDIHKHPYHSHGPGKCESSRIIVHRGSSANFILRRALWHISYVTEMSSYRLGNPIVEIWHAY